MTQAAPAANPLLDFSGLPRFDAIRSEHVTAAVETLLAAARSAVDAVATDPRPPTWDNVVEPLEDALDRLDRAWGAVNHLNAVVSTPALREAYNGNLPKVTAFHTDLGQDERLYARYKALAATPAHASFTPAQKKAVDNALRDFRLSGAELPPPQKARLKEVEEELANLAARFDDNVLDATNAWSLHLDDAARLAGVPAEVVSAARTAAEADGKPGWKLTLRMPCYLPVMQYADDRELRATLHRAYTTRGSELGADPAWDNTSIIDRTLALRHEAARLLGFPNYAEVSLAPKMARDAAEVLAFLHDLATRSKPWAERDFAELAAFARDELGLPELAPWDLAYASEKLKAARYSFSDQEVRQYFPEDRVLAGLFGLVQTIYGVGIRAAKAVAWHDDVRFYEVVDGAGSVVGRFFLDNYAREGKQGGAWMDDAISRRRAGTHLQLPVTYLTCNLSAPVDGKPATFTHDEVLTIFHEFGHGLHHLLTQVDVAAVSGLSGVEWDAVELPSQFMENFCWEWDVVRSMTGHVDNGEPIPRALFDRMLAAKNFQSGLQMVRQIEMATVDMRLHSDYDPAAPRPPYDVLADVRRDVAVTPRAAYDRYLNGFGHIFAGGYAAGYYSYKWAEVLSADAYSLFEEAGVLSPAAGAKFRDEVLSRGGSRTALESFVAFRGRPPQIDALLRHNGMTLSS
jgi:oligopeptidase A